MNRFDYSRAESVGQAVGLLAEPAAKVLAGGTNLVDLMKYDVVRPERLVDIGRLPLATIENGPDGGLRIGALVTNAATAANEEVASRYPLLASAILAGATGQLRNAATTGGNIMQHTRCYYFYDAALPCNKRHPGTGCPAITGQNRIHAILGASEHCIATHPSDMCVAMAALDATVVVVGPGGERRIPFGEFHRLPGNTPAIDNGLATDEIITAVDLPAATFGANHTYLKLRDRLSYAFALVSVAAALKIEGGTIADARIALGGVAHKPWRDPDAERLLVGRRADPDGFRVAADHILRDARGYEHNAFKIELARRAIVRALGQAAAGTPQSQSDKRIQ